MSTPLLKTKVTIPPIQSRMVPRARLHDRLARSLDENVSLLLVSARPGAGKSSLISRWVQESTLPAAWLSLDDHDNDPARFLRYLSSAFDPPGKLPGRDIAALFEGGRPPDPEVLLSELIATFGQGDPETLLVLDDYHVIQNEWIHAFIGALIERPGHGVLLVLLTRVDPPLPLSRLRVRGQMIEIRDADLQFESEETERYLNEILQLGLSRGQISILNERTEGWIAGLQMAAITMRERRSVGSMDEFVHAFGGSHRYVMDYLMDEVMAKQPKSIVDFLKRTSILDRLCPELCDAVRFGYPRFAHQALAPGQQDVPEVPLSQEILRQLDMSNMFLIPLDDERKWYRYHHLFGDLLRNELKQGTSDDEIRELHLHASRWHRQHGSIEEAMVQAMQAREYDHAATMIEDEIVRMLSGSEVPVLLGWIERLPEGVRQAHPWIAVYRATTLAFAGQVDGVEKILASVESRLSSNQESTPLRGHIAAVRAYVANQQGDPERAIEMAALSRESLGEDHWNGRSMAAYSLGDVYFARDDMEEAEEALRELLHLGERSGHPLMTVTALCELASIRKVQGRLTEAGNLYEEAWNALYDSEALATRLRCHYEFGLADLLYEWNRLEEAHEHAEIGMEIRSRLGGYYVTGDLPMMRILQARGDLEAALDVLHDLEVVLESARVQYSGTIALRSAKVLLWLAVGDMARARICANSCSGGTDLEALAEAWLLNAEGNCAQAMTIIEARMESAKEDSRLGHLVKWLCLRALCTETQGRREEASSAILEAIMLARPEGFGRSFLDYGAPLENLIRREMLPDPSVESDGKATDRLVEGYARELLAAFGEDRKIRRESAAALEVQYEPKTLAEPLTDRELEVLTHLAKGLSNKVLAERLVVAPSTIKQHLKNIYSKLDVHSRTEAVARAREADLIE